MLIKLIICAVVALCVGFLIGGRVERRIFTNSPDGYIILDKNEEGNDRIAFQLGMEYDDISKYHDIVFRVVKR